MKQTEISVSEKDRAAGSDSYISILSPRELEDYEYQSISETAFHDLGMDIICSKLTNKPEEQSMIRRVLSRITADPEVVQYRCDVFADFMHFPDMRNQMLKLLEKVNYLQDYVRKKRNYDKLEGAWDLLHRLAEINDYIACVEMMVQCLEGTDISSEGLLHLKEVFAAVYHDAAFEELKKDIASLKATTANLKSVTLGINLNDRFEADSIGLISINDKPFSQSNILADFLGKITAREDVKKGNDWNGSYSYQAVNSADVKNSAAFENMMVGITAGINPLMGLGLGLAKMQNHEQGTEVMQYMDRISNHLIGAVVKNLKGVLDKYVTISIYRIANLVPEFIYYIRWAEYMEDLMARGYTLCEAHIAEEDGKERVMHARGLYNLKLASASEAETIVTNDLDFDSEHRVYILTGANRGGKTTITQAVGQLFVLAQGGIYVPAESFTFHPADNIFTHFPADEDKTMDFGRLGEECSRFRELYNAATENSLMLLNETFSTTSFEEGYYIAKDASRAILKKGVRTIYNTHMHKLAMELDQIDDGSFTDHAASLVMRSDEGKRSYKVYVAPPEGLSYARDIAEKYGVTYEMLIQ